MTSLHFSGSPWFLLLLAPGLFILWRQYRGGAGARGRGQGMVLMLLQAAALLLLVASLMGPEWVRRHAEFHNPSVMILRDRSGSFQAGAYLGLGEEYTRLEEAIAAEYRSRRFDVMVADFNERAWPVSGFPGKSSDAVEPGGAASGTSGPDAPPTSLAALADFVDSAGGQNLQAAFLFSDGRANLDSGKASRTWPVPVYPIVLPVKKVSEIQPDRVGFSSPEGNGDPGGLEVAWSPVGPVSAGPTVRILKGDKTLYTGELPLSDAQGDFRVATLTWRPGAGQGKMEDLRAVVVPAGGRGNFDPYNDTLAVSAWGGRGERRILVVKPLRSLDEKGMMDLFNALDDARVELMSVEEIMARPLSAKDQVWVEAGVLSRGGLLKTLRETSAKVVAYARPGALPADIAGVKVKRVEFSPGAETRAARAAADVFPDGVVRLKSIASRSLAAPASEPPWREAAVLSEGGRRGILMGWFPLGPGKEAFFLALPPMWDLLFDPQADFATRENLGQILRATALLAEREEGVVKAVHPRRAYAGIPFDLEFTLPASAEGRPASGLEVAVSSRNGEGAAKWPITGPGPETFRLEGRTLAAGRYTLSLMRGGELLWRDSLEVAAKPSLELARIGFDRPALLDMAGQSGGRLIAPEPGEPSKVALTLPNLPGAQIKVERTQSTRLYNTRWQFLLAVLLLTASWLLRKRWDYD